MQLSISAKEYAYPIKDPLLATIAATPEPMMIKVKDAPARIITVPRIVNRKISDIMWHDSETRVSAALQKKEAPLIFIIPGTGGTYKTSTVKYLQNIYWNAGYHVICLNSPFSLNFAITTSESAYPGITEEDAKDLYKLMQIAYDQVKSDIKVKGFYLTGYSLGGLDSAFISKLDEDEQVFNFKKVLIINPPVDLYSSVTVLDNFLPVKIKSKDEEGAIDIIMKKITTYFAARGEVGFGQDFLYKVNKLSPITDPQAKKLIGGAFKLFLSDIVMTADILNNQGYIVNKELNIGDPLLPYFKESLLWTFREYFDYYLYPYWKKNHDGRTKDDLIKAVSLYAIKNYIKTSEKMGLMHNADDIIINKKELAFLKASFGERAKIYPCGGHCGNIQFKENVNYMLNFFNNTNGE